MGTRSTRSTPFSLPLIRRIVWAIVFGFGPLGASWFVASIADYRDAAQAGLVGHRAGYVSHDPDWRPPLLTNAMYRIGCAP